MSRNHRKTRIVGCLAAASGTIPACLGLASLFLGESTSPTLLLLLLEPLFWLAMLLFTLVAAMRGRPLLALTALFSLVLYAILLRLPSDAPPSHRESVRFPSSARQCRAITQSASDAPLSVSTWNMEGQTSPAAEAALVQLETDVIVLHDAPNPETVERIAPVDGDWLYTASSADGGTALILRRGHFLPCRRSGPVEKTDRAAPRYWTFALPALPSRRASAVLTYAALPDRGVTPLLAFTLDSPHSPLEVASWPQVFEGSARRLEAITRTIDSPYLVVSGSTYGHGTFRRFLGRTAAGGLSLAPPRPTWPAAILGFPSPALYHSERVWHGEDWDVEAVEGQRLDWSASHHALVTRLRSRALD